MRSKEEVEKLLYWLQDAAPDMDNPVYAALAKVCIKILQCLLKQPAPDVERLVERCQRIDAQIEAELAATGKSVVS